MHRVTIPITEIRLPEQRLRPLDPVKVTALAASVREIGLLNPPTLTAEKVLVAGFHRYAAARELGWTELDVNLLAPGTTNEDAEIAEIDENLVRNELNELDLSLHLLRRKELYEIKHPETRRGGNPKLRGTVPGFVEDIAAKMGYGKRSVEGRIKIARALRDHADALRPLPCADRHTDLALLATLTAEQLAAVVSALVQQDFTDVPSAVAFMRGDQPTENLDLKALTDLLGPQEKRDLHRALTMNLEEARAQAVGGKGRTLTEKKAVYDTIGIRQIVLIMAPGEYDAAISSLEKLCARYGVDSNTEAVLRLISEAGA